MSTVHHIKSTPAAEPETSTPASRAALRNAIAARDALSLEVLSLEQAAARAASALQFAQGAFNTASAQIEADIANFYGAEIKAGHDVCGLDLPEGLEERQAVKLGQEQKLSALRKTFADLLDEARGKSVGLANLRTVVERLAWLECQKEADKLVPQFVEAKQKFWAIEDALHGLGSIGRGDYSGVGYLSPKAVAALSVKRPDCIVGNDNDPRVRAIRKWQAFRDKLLADPDARLDF